MTLSKNIKMPLGKMYKYVPKSRRKRKRRRGNKNRTMNQMVIRGPSVMPDAVYVKLKYYDSFVVNSAATAQYIVIKGNSIYDPDQAPGGHQPLGRDQWAAFYQKYQVLGSKCTATCSAYVGALEPYTFALAPLDTQPPNPDIRTISELPYAKHVSCNPQPSANSGPKIVTYMSTKAKLGYKNIKQVENTISNKGTDPSEVWFWAAGVQADATSRQYKISVMVEYYVKFMDRIDLLTS